MQYATTAATATAPYRHISFSTGIPARPEMTAASPLPPTTVFSPLVTRYSSFSQPQNAFAPHFEKLAKLPARRDLWPEDSEGPALYTVSWAASALEHLRTIAFVPSRVVASTEGGVAICFIRGDTYADMEFLNSGEILAVVSQRNGEPVVWHVQPSIHGLAAAFARIREHVA